MTNQSRLGTQLRLREISENERKTNPNNAKQNYRREACSTIKDDQNSLFRIFPLITIARHEVALAGGWKSERMVLHYSAQQSAEQNAVAKFL